MPPNPGKRVVLFLDRDGVINEDRGYVYRVGDFCFIDGSLGLCRNARAAGMAIVVVSDQAGIGRGYYTEDQCMLLTDWMCSSVSAQGVMIDGVYYCPFHSERGLGKYRRDSFDRKRNLGIFSCQERFGIIAEGIYFYGR